LIGVHETVRLSDPPAVMVDCPLGLKANTPLERGAVVGAERNAAIGNGNESSKLVIVTAPFEGMYAGA